MTRIAKPRSPILRRPHPRLRGLLAAYLFAEGGGDIARDLARRMGDGAITGAEWQMGRWGPVLQFGSGDDVRTGKPVPVGNLTFACRVLTTSTNTLQYIGGVQTGGGDGGRFLRFTPSAEFEWEIIGSGIRDVLFAGVQANTWYDIVGVKDDAAAQIRLYVDGILRGTTSISGVNYTTTPENFTMGERPDGTGNNLLGSLDHFLIYDRVLSHGEIAQHHIAPYDPFRRPILPTRTLSATINTTTVRLTWQDNAEDEDGFSIERSNDGVNFGEIGTVAAGVTQYDDAAAQIGATHYYRLRAFNANGNSDYSNVAEVTTA